jgi:hypothetical protein
MHRKEIQRADSINLSNLVHLHLLLGGDITVLDLAGFIGVWKEVYLTALMVPKR